MQTDVKMRPTNAKIMHSDKGLTWLLSAVDMQLPASCRSGPSCSKHR